MENNDLSNEELAELKNLAKALKQMRESDNKSDQNAVAKIENAVADIEKEQEESNNIEEKSVEVLKTEKNHLFLSNQTFKIHIQRKNIGKLIIQLTKVTRQNTLKIFIKEKQD